MANFVLTAGEAGQVAWRAPGASAAGSVRSGPGAGRDVREWETDILCASEPDGLAAGAGALPRARRRCEAGKRTHGPGQRACLALLAATALLALAAPAQAQTEIWSATLTPQDTGNGALGCDSTESNTAAQCSNTAVLSDNDFTLGSTDHTIGIIELAGESLQITSTGVFTDADTLALVLGTTSLAFSRGVTIQGGRWQGLAFYRPLLDRRHRRQRQAHLPHRARRAHRAGRDRQRAVPDRPLLDRPGQHRRLRHHRLQD